MFAQQNGGVSTPDPQAFLFSSRGGQSSEHELSALLPLDPYAAAPSSAHSLQLGGAAILHATQPQAFPPGFVMGPPGTGSPSGLTLASVIGAAPPSPMQHLGSGGYVMLPHSHPTHMPPSPPNAGSPGGSAQAQITPMLFTQNNGSGASGFLHMTSSANTSGIGGYPPPPPPGSNGMQHVVFSHAPPVVQTAGNSLQMVAGPNGSYTFQAIPSPVGPPQGGGTYVMSHPGGNGGYAQAGPQQATTYVAYPSPQSPPHLMPSPPHIMQAPSPAQFFMQMHSGNSGSNSGMAQPQYASSVPQHVPSSQILASNQHMFVSSSVLSSPPPPPSTSHVQSVPGVHSAGVLSMPPLGSTPSSRKRGKKAKKAPLTPRSQAAKEQAQRQKELEKASKGGKPFDEEPFELDVAKKQLIVNFVSQTVSDEEFKSLFTSFGELAASRIIYDKHTHRSKGYGFVYFKKGEDAIAAIKALNGVELHAKSLKVGYATPQRPSPPDDEDDEEHHPALAAVEDVEAANGEEDEASSSSEADDNDSGEDVGGAASRT